MDLHALSDTTPPLHAATVVLLREGEHGLEVLLLQRHGASPVLGGAHVFPGGKVDPDDTLLFPWVDQPAAALDAAWRSRDEPAPHPLAQPVPPPSPSASAAAAYVAALRENFEETGLLIACAPSHSTAQPVALSATTVQAARDQQRSGAPLDHTLRTLQLRLHTRALYPWARWITPMHGAVSQKRFDTRFFLAALPPGQETQVDEREITQALWLSPRDALQQYAQGQLTLAPPQIMSLVQLLPHPDVTSALAAVQTRPPVRIEPEAHIDADGKLMHCYPGDALHRERVARLLGPTRLLYRGQRFEPEGGYERLWH
jgi:8-oxo-dGTP pyrophosphatase MutT (NUDIX family)